MNIKTLTTALLLAVSLGASAQSVNDPIVMKINGVPVTRSEFEYSYNKNNSEGVIDKKTVDEYVDLFVNYKLKVQAALDEKIDTTQAFLTEFASYRDQQIRPAMITDADVEAEAYRLYKNEQHRVDSLGGMVLPAHILLMVRQNSSEADMAVAKTRIDSIYNVLKEADFDESLFGELAKKHTDDRGSQANGGLLPWIYRGQTLKEFDDMIYSMQKGETSAPFLTTAGYHIVQLRDKANYFPYDSLKTNILNYIERRNIKEQIITARLDSLAKVQGITPQQVLDKKREEMVATDKELAFLIQEYHDGLLLIELSTQKVWDKGSKDVEGLKNFFKKNKKKYVWDEPRFKGMTIRTREESDLNAVKKSVKGLDFADWNEKLRTTFNADSVLRIRVEKGVFKKGDNAIIDKYEFKNADANVRELKGYPYTGSYGKMLKKPEEYTDVKELVISDYQEFLEKAWVEELRKKYSVEVYDDVLKTVNKH